MLTKVKIVIFIVWFVVNVILFVIALEANGADIILQEPDDDDSLQPGTDQQNVNNEAETETGNRATGSHVNQSETFLQQSDSQSMSMFDVLNTPGTSEQRDLSLGMIYVKA